jgi:hypothetical protein
MRWLKIAAPLAALVLTGVIAEAADARHRPGHGNRPGQGWHGGQWHDRYENRRKARRAGILAGVVTSSVAGAAAESNARRRYDECLEASWSYYYPNDRYNYQNGDCYDCERRRYEVEMYGRRNARRAGVIVGVTTHAIVRN